MSAQKFCSCAQWRPCDGHDIVIKGRGLQGLQKSVCCGRHGSVCSNTALSMLCTLLCCSWTVATHEGKRCACKRWLQYGSLTDCLQGISAGMEPPPPAVSVLTSLMCVCLSVWDVCLQRTLHGRAGGLVLCAAVPAAADSAEAEVLAAGIVRLWPVLLR